jgi:hypothetical protein
VVARRNAGLDDSNAHNVSIGMALINYRLEHIHLFERQTAPVAGPDSPGLSSITLRACRSAKTKIEVWNRTKVSSNISRHALAFDAFNDLNGG